jgi:hypothetical protein
LEILIVLVGLVLLVRLVAWAVGKGYFGNK